MISCKLYGRLGNQLFIIATTVAYALRHNSKYGTQYVIPRYITKPPGLDTDPVYFRHFPYELFLGDFLEYHEPKDQSYKEIPTPNLFGYHDHFQHLKLSGYFQSEKYFADQREGVIKALAPAFTMQTYNPDEGKNYVSLHVRRGDYLEKPECHPVLIGNMDYYVSAMNYFKKRGWHRFVVFSDDMEWCKQVFTKERFVGSRFIYSINQSPIEDLQSMKACAHHIIANSSFSWWGAWLNENPDKIVIAPKRWYGPALSHINTQDLLPEKWIQL